jgi:hypothetical protein
VRTVWKKIGKVNNKPCMGKNTDGKISRNTYRKDSWKLEAGGWEAKGKRQRITGLDVNPSGTGFTGCTRFVLLQHFPDESAECNPLRPDY